MEEPRATYSYDDLRLTIEGSPAHDTFRVLAIDVATGAHAEESFVLSALDGHRVEALSGTMRGSTREVGAAHGGAQSVARDAEQVGALLASAVLNGRVRDLFDAASARIGATRGRGLRLDLDLSGAPALADVPWELLFVRPRFLASQARTPIVRMLGTAPPMPPATVGGAVRVLVVAANPRDLAQLDLAAERARIEQATRAVREQGLLELEWLEAASPRRLRERLQDASFHVIHFVGHSDVGPDGTGVIVLERDDGSAIEVGETLLANLIDGQSATLRLVVLNSCKSARTSVRDPLTGVAATLMSLGLPAVVAMQFPISDAAAIAFAEAFYASLAARREPIDAAVAAGRLAIWTDVSDVEWATPVLFMRDPNAGAFEFRRPERTDTAPIAPVRTASPPTATATQPAQPAQRIVVTNAGPVSFGGDIVISGGTVAGRDQVVSDAKRRRRWRR